MRWVLGAVGVLVVLVATVYAVGLLLPKSHVASASARYAATPQQVWAVLTDPSAFPQWRPGLARVELLPDVNGQRGWREYGSDEPVSYRVVESDAPRRLVARIADENLPYGGTWTYDVAPAGSGTRLTITERGEIYNPVFRFVARFIIGYTGTMTAVLRALGARFGETVTPEPGTDGGRGA
jgi:uncharacterized protein YndB with AHSA1/START domain